MNDVTELEDSFFHYTCFCVCALSCNAQVFHGVEKSSLASVIY